MATVFGHLTTKASFLFCKTQASHLTNILPNNWYVNDHLAMPYYLHLILHRVVQLKSPES